MSNHKKLEANERWDDLVEPIMRHPDLNILVGTALIAKEEVKRPAAGDIPRCWNSGQPGGDLLRPPCIPRIEIRVERLRIWHALAIDHRRDATHRPEICRVGADPERLPRLLLSAMSSSSGTESSAARFPNGCENILAERVGFEPTE